MHDSNRCILCKEVFSDSNIHSIYGWKETHLSQMCEDCYDEEYLIKVFPRGDINDSTGSLFQGVIP